MITAMCLSQLSTLQGVQETIGVQVMRALITALILITSLSTSEAIDHQDLECGVTQAQLDAEYEAAGTYEITVEEFCSL